MNGAILRTSCCRPAARRALSATPPPLPPIKPLTRAVRVDNARAELRRADPIGNAIFGGAHASVPFLLAALAGMAYLNSSREAREAEENRVDDEAREAHARRLVDAGHDPPIAALLARKRQQLAHWREEARGGDGPPASETALTRAVGLVPRAEGAATRAVRLEREIAQLEAHANGKREARSSVT